MIQSNNVQLKNDKLEEVVFGLERDFPYTSIYADLGKYVGGCAPWHWHQEFEFFFVIKGNIRYHLEDGYHDFSIGEGGFINSDVLHMTTPVTDGPAITSVQIMDQRFIAGSLGSRLETKYIMPIMGNSALNIYKLTKENVAHNYMLTELRRAFECENEREVGYEFKVRNHISNAWLHFFKMTESLCLEDNHKKSLDSTRIKEMMSFINQNFKEKLSLGQIAEAANISEREALRCFRRCVKITPFEYLVNRRIQLAADCLRGTEESIMMVGELCGFSSGSYFGKVFKEKMGCTPNAFKKRSNQ